MGLTYANIEVENLLAQRTMPLKALVDTGVVFLRLPEQVAVQLGFDVTGVATREVVLANGHRQTVPMIGPVRVKFAGRHCDLAALVLRDEPLFGAVPMEMMDLVVHPATQTLSINPANPFVPVALAK